MSEEATVKKSTVLVVDDEPISVKVLCHHLEQEYDVLVATNGVEALQLASSFLPDLILLDALMPGMDGYEVCTRLKADPRMAPIPVIFVTGLSDRNYEKRGLELGAVDFVVKPFVAKLVRARLRNHLELKKYRDRLEVLVKERTAELQQKQQQLTELNGELEQRVADEVRMNREKDRLLIQQERFASVGQLAAGVAHEINNPMGFIMSNLRSLHKYSLRRNEYLAVLQGEADRCFPAELTAQLAELNRKLDIPYISEDIFSLISESLEGAERVRKIVLDLMNFAHVDGNELVETDLNDCVRRAVNFVHNEINSVADLELSLTDIPPVRCSPQQINQVFVNLLMNAVHAIATRGVVTIRTECIGTDSVVTVSDTGHGIPEEIAGRIFEPFFTTKDVGKGTGLGLSVCYDIIKSHGGQISMTSQAGVGTSFMIKLPVSTPGTSDTSP